MIDNEENKSKEKDQVQTGTRRRRAKSSTKAQTFLNSMNSNETGRTRERRSAEGLEDFEPLPPARLTRKGKDDADKQAGDDGPVTHEGFSQLPSDALKQQYYNQFIQQYQGTDQYIPYYPQLSQAQNTSGSQNELMKKLNYMIHLLEDQKDEHTQGVTEELVLYVFLGVFVIFIVDSFARAGKYTR